MKILISIITSLICLNGFSQKRETQYFLINRKDTLIKKQTTTKKNKYERYIIINENKIIKRYHRSSKINGDDIEFSTFDEISFSFNRSNDTIVELSFIKNLEIIKDRKKFLKKNIELDETKSEFIFIEPIKCNKYILRKVIPVIFE